MSGITERDFYWTPDAEYTARAEYCGFTIVPKRDWSEHERAKGAKGWVVVKDGVNVMPGATWAHTTEQACALIDAYVLADGDGPKFWAALRLVQRYSKAAASAAAIVAIGDRI